MTAKRFRYLYRTLRKYEHKRAWLRVLIAAVAVGLTLCAITAGYMFFHMTDDIAINLSFTILFSVVFIATDVGITMDIVDRISFYNEKITDIMEDYDVA